MPVLTRFYSSASHTLGILPLIACHPAQVHPVPSTIQSGFLANPASIPLPLVALDLSRSAGPTSSVGVSSRLQCLVRLQATYPVNVTDFSFPERVRRLGCLSGRTKSFMVWVIGLGFKSHGTDGIHSWNVGLMAIVSGIQGLSPMRGCWLKIIEYAGREGGPNNGL